MKLKIKNDYKNHNRYNSANSNSGGQIKLTESFNCEWEVFQHQGQQLLHLGSLSTHKYSMF